jgi:hypothetical protein
MYQTPVFISNITKNKTTILHFHKQEEILPDMDKIKIIF